MSAEKTPTVAEAQAALNAAEDRLTQAKRDEERAGLERARAMTARDEALKAYHAAFVASLSRDAQRELGIRVAT